MNRDNTAAGWNVTMPVLGLLLLLLLVLYRDTTLYLAGLWSEWEDGSYSHGFLVLLISSYIVYRTRGTLARMTPCPFAPALLLLSVCGLLWAFAGLANIQLLQIVVLLPLVMSVIWAVLGTKIALKLLLPVMFVWFAIPVWSPLLPLLQRITADNAFWLTRLYGVPAFLQDFTIYLPSGQLSIHNACSGLHYLLAGVTLGVFYAWLNYRRLWHRILVITIAAGAAILVNILRVFIITLLAYKTDMQHSYVEDHLVLGWYLFGGLVVILLIADLLLGIPVPESNNASVSTPGKNCKYGYPQRLVLFSVTALLISVGPIVVGGVTGQALHPDIQVLRLPEGVEGWQGPAAGNDSWQPVYRGAISQQGIYRKDAAGVFLYIGYYPRQSQGTELINDLNRINNVESWQVSATERIEPGQGLASVVEAELVSLSGEKRLVWYSYRVAGRYTTSVYIAKLLQVAGLLSGESGAAIVALATRVENDVPAARERLADFMLTMYEPLARTADGGT